MHLGVDFHLCESTASRAQREQSEDLQNCVAQARIKSFFLQRDAFVLLMTHLLPLPLP